MLDIQAETLGPIGDQLFPADSKTGISDTELEFSVFLLELLKLRSSQKARVPRAPFFGGANLCQNCIP